MGVVVESEVSCDGAAKLAPLLYEKDPRITSWVSVDDKDNVRVQKTQMVPFRSWIIDGRLSKSPDGKGLLDGRIATGDVHPVPVKVTLYSCEAVDWFAFVKTTLTVPSRCTSADG